MFEITAIGSAWSLLPPVIAVVLAIITRRVLLSLGLGILLGVLLIKQFDILASFHYLSTIIIGLIWDNGWQMSKLYIIAFLLILGMMTAFIAAIGGTRAFGDWALERIKTQRGAKLNTMLLGILIFIDDYFNSLAVGNISRPITDRHKISRAKLAYIIDSTAAPICILAPISSWGAFVIALLGSVLVTHEFLDHSPLVYFIQLIPMNFYALFAIVMVFCVSWFGWNIGPMRKHENQAKQGILYDKSKGIQAGASLELEKLPKGNVSDLVVPFLVLIFGTFLAIITTGYQVLLENNEPFTFFGALENTRSSLALLYGGFLGLLSTLILAFRKHLTIKDYQRETVIGIRGMLPAIYILLFAWTIIEVINTLQTGHYLANLLDGTLNPQWLPLLLFFIAGLMAFCTGTSWGTFGIMLPIAGNIAGALEPALMLPSLAAVLSGAVFGDHCSPISDTTILSSTGAGCPHIDHFITQLPYALIIAIVSSAGYLVLGFTSSIIAALIASILCFTFIGAILQQLKK